MPPAPVTGAPTRSAEPESDTSSSARSSAPTLRRTRRPSLAILGSRGIPARYGGFETFVQEVSVRLVELGIDVTVFCEADETRGADEFRGVRLEHVRAWAPGPLRTLQFDASCLAASAHRFDVVYMLGYGSSTLCALSKLRGDRVWINMDGLEWRRSKWGPLARTWLRAMERIAFAGATRLVFDNARLRDEVESRRRRRSNSVVIEYGAEIYERDDELAPLAEFALQSGGYDLVVCRAEPENHVLEILRAHAASGVARELAIVADLSRATRYDAAVRRAAGSNVRLLGPIYEPRRLQPLRRHAHLYLHGHSVGGTNPSLVEAMACGNCVVAHDNPFNRETLDGAGLFWRDERELVEVLRAAERIRPSERAELRRRSLERVRSRYSWDRIAAEYAKLIAESLA